MKPSPMIAAVLADLQEDVVQAPGWFWPAMASIALWGALGASQARLSHSAPAAAALEAPR